MMNDLIYLSSQNNVLPFFSLYHTYFEINAPKPQSAVTFLIFLSSLSWSLIKLYLLNVNILQQSKSGLWP